MPKGKPRPGRRLLSQYFLVFSAFVIMVLMSNFFAGSIAGESVYAYGEQVLESSVERIAALLYGNEIILDEIAFSVNEMREAFGSDALSVEEELVKRLEWHHAGNESKIKYYAIHGVIDDIFVSSGEWISGEDFEPLEHPWYKGAYEKQGEAYYSDPYTDIKTGKEVVSISKLLYEDGESYGVIAIDIYFSVIEGYVAGMDLMGSGYGVVLDNERRFIIHPHEPFRNSFLSALGSEYEKLERILNDEGEIRGQEYLSYEDLKLVAFYKPLYNGWYVGLVSPVNVFHHSITAMRTALAATGAVMLLLLCFVLTLTHLAADKAEKASNRIKTMLDAMPFGCTMWDKNLKIFDCNKEVIKLFGVRGEKDFIERFHELSPERQPDGIFSAEKWALYNSRAFHEGKVVFEWVHKLDDGTLMPSEITLVRIPYDDDNSVVAGYIRDLREHTHMMNEINHRSELLSMETYIAELLLTSQVEYERDIEALLIKSMESLGLCVDTDRVQIWRNEDINGCLHFVHTYEWLSETGKQKTKVPIGLKFPYHDKPEWEKMFKRGEYINGPLSEMPEDDREFLNVYEIKAIVIIPLFLENNFWGFFSIDDCKNERTFTVEEINIFRSVSLMMASSLLRAHMSIELREALEEARAANKAKSNFLSNMSHEIRTPMNAVLGMTELLLKENLNARQSGYVHDINISGQTLLSIINDILDMSKIEAGKLELVPVHYDFAGLLDNLNSMFMYMAEKKGIEFRFEHDSILPRYLHGDDIRLRQVLTNICGNAVKFTNKGYVKLSISSRDKQLIFVIEDTGTGIKKEEAGKLFSAFSQADTKKNRGVVGTGLGLAISKAFTEMMGGNIGLESEYGTGTTFTVRIPLVEGEESTATAKKEESDAEIPTFTGANVLVVDDNEFNLKVAEGLLKLSEITAQTASSGEEAIKLVCQNEYDIVFMDHMMPGMDGVETTEVIRKLGGKYSSLPIIALTANAIHGAREMFLSNGFDGFISKPIDLKELCELLKEWIPENKFKANCEQLTVNEEPREKEDFLTSMKRINEIDTAVGLKHVHGLEDLYKETAELFCRKLMSKCENMAEFLNSGNLLEFETAVHAMKSMLATVGAIPLSETALELELSAKRGEAAFCAEHYPAFREKLNNLYKQLTNIFGEYISLTSK